VSPSQRRPEVHNIQQLSLETLDALTAPDLVIWVASDERPLKGGAGYVDWRANGWLSRLIANGNFKCQRGERLLTLSQGRLQASRVFLLGLGEAKSYNARSAAEVAQEALAMFDDAAVTHVALALPGSGDSDAHKQLLESILAGFGKKPENKGPKNSESAKMTTWGPWRKM
jgi:Cytosol aminopeptidase family, N-terminal domain